MGTEPGTRSAGRTVAEMSPSAPPPETHPGPLARLHRRPDPFRAHPTGRPPPPPGRLPRHPDGPRRPKGDERPPRRPHGRPRHRPDPAARPGVGHGAPGPRHRGAGVPRGKTPPRLPPPARPLLDEL